MNETKIFFQLSHFEKYNTKVMFLPWAYDATLWGCTFALLLAFICGPELFLTPIFGITPTLLLEVVLYTSGVLTSHTVIAWNIYK